MPPPVFALSPLVVAVVLSSFSIGLAMPLVVRTRAESRYCGEDLGALLFFSFGTGRGCGLFSCMKVIVSVSLQSGDNRGCRKEGGAEGGNERKEKKVEIMSTSSPKKEMKARLAGSASAAWDAPPQKKRKNVSLSATTSPLLFPYLFSLIPLSVSRRTPVVGRRRKLSASGGLPRECEHLPTPSAHVGVVVCGSRHAGNQEDVWPDVHVSHFPESSSLAQREKALVALAQVQPVFGNLKTKRRDNNREMEEGPSPSKRTDHHHEENEGRKRGRWSANDSKRNEMEKKPARSSAVVVGWGKNRKRSTS
ncbi:hypothetical protein B0H13DRAFT_1893364 [Mycena leptocephala]|nr:hypothetical protein B0H13DRAFT_1893364 [Mycena leptocephala]